MESKWDDFVAAHIILVSYTPGTAGADMNMYQKQYISARVKQQWAKSHHRCLYASCVWGDSDSDSGRMFASFSSRAALFQRQGYILKKVASPHSEATSCPISWFKDILLKHVWLKKRTPHFVLLQVVFLNDAATLQKDIFHPLNRRISPRISPSAASWTTSHESLALSHNKT